MSEFLTLSEEKLFELVKAGSQAAYSELYERFKKPLLVYAVNKVSPIEAEDIVHDLFIKLWDNRKDIQITGNFSHYIFRSLRNRIIDFFLHHQHVQKYIDSFQEFSLHEFSNLPDYRVREELFYAKIDNLLIQFGPRGRTIVRLRMEGYSNQEVADKLGVSEKTVRNQYSLMLKHLKEKLPPIIYLMFFV